ncbi:hypothetical protein V6N13_024871 [Hibiscus sabdariffa]
MSSFDENEDVNSTFVDSMMVSNEEERQNPTAKKSFVDESTGKRKRKSKWWTHFSVDEEDPAFASFSVPKLWKLDHNLCRKKLAKMLIVDELPFAFVKREGFIEFCKALNTLFKLPSCTTATRDCCTLFIEQRNELKRNFMNLHSRVCLTTDT